MNILVYEKLLGSNALNNRPSVIKEAKFILNSLFSDFAQYNQKYKISLLINKQYCNDISKSVSIIPRNYSNKPHEDIILNKSLYDKVLVLEPENNYGLYETIKKLEENGIETLNCLSSLIKLTTDKLMTYKYLKNYSKHIPSYSQDYIFFKENEKIVAKIIDGFSAENLYIFENRNKLIENKRLITKNHFFQKYIDGSIVSLNIVSNKNSFNVLSINEQIYEFTSENQISLKQINIGKYNHLYKNYKNIISGIINNFKGFYGFYGIDGIITKNNNFIFLEINPRLTTSYVGLSRSLGFNPLKLLFENNYNFDISKNKTLSVNL